MTRISRTMAWRTAAVRYATMLHEAGATAPAVEDAVTALIHGRGLQGTVMATPTALWVDLDGARVVRLRPASNDLARQAALGALGERAARDRAFDAGAFGRELDRIAGTKGPWPAWAERLAFVGVGGGVAVAMGGGVADGIGAAAVAAGVAAVDGVVRGRAPRLADGIAGVVAAAGAALAAGIGADPARTALAAVTVLAPGLALTTAAEETASGHWSSGTARLGGALVTLIQLAVGLSVGAMTFGPIPAGWTPEVVLPPWAPAAAHLALAPVVAVLVRVRRTELLPVTAVAMAAALPTHGLAAPVGALVGALAATVLGAAAGRWSGAPASVFVSPALVLLVPGALGVHGMRDAIAGGPGTAWAVGAAILAIVAGVFTGQSLADVVAAPRRRPA